MPLIPFPNVPSLPGVPALPRSAGQLIAGVATLLTADDPGVGGLTQDPQWGIFNADGNPVVLADSVIAFEHMKEWRISDYPVEEGAFASYNKVETPFDERIAFARGGSDADRAAFLSGLENVAGSLELYTAVTPEITYTDANIVRYSYSRHARNGVTLIVAEVVVRQVRVVGAAAFSNTQSPAGAAQTNGGTVQTQTPTAGQSSAAAGGAT